MMLAPVRLMRKTQRRMLGLSSFKFDGPFSPVRGENLGPLIRAHNMCMLLDAEVDPKEGNKYHDDLRLLHWWAEVLNDYCDVHKVSDDAAMGLSAACWLSRQPADWERLN